MWLLSLAAAWAGELKLDVTTVDFAPSANLERSVAPLLTRLHAMHEDWLGLTLPAIVPLEVVIIEDEKTYAAREVASHGKRAHTAGYYEPSAQRVTVWRRGSDERAKQTLLHEVSHYMLFGAGMGDIPPWLQEGLSVVASTATMDDEMLIWLVPDDEAAYVRSRPRPKASALIALDQEAWEQLGPTPWTKPEYPYGWALCAFLLETEAGRRTLSDLLVAGPAALEVVEKRYPGGAAALDAAFASWQPKRLQLPPRATGPTSAGWGRCPDGSLVRLSSDATCGRWITGPDGLQRYVEEAPVP